MMSTVENLRRLAAQNPLRVVLPEVNDPRVQQAALRLSQNGLACPVLIGEANQYPEIAEVDGVEFRSITDESLLERCSQHLFNRMAHKGIDQAEARTLALEPVFFAALLVAIGEAEAAVAGSVAPTPHVVRATLRCIGTAPNTKTLSSFFLMQFPDRAVTFADCGLVPDPNSQQLADIAVAAATSHRRLTGEEPRVAMLSFSTHGSAKHPKTEKVIEATRQVRKQAPGLVVDGELQFDAAWVPEVAQRKCPESEVAGQANVLIFPDLDSGNIAYKIAQRLGGALALGPLIQGAAKPMMDLSRGCSVEDIVNVSVIASVLSDD